MDQYRNLTHTYNTNFNTPQFKTGSSYTNYVYRGGYSHRRPRLRARGFKNAYGRPYLGRKGVNSTSYVEDMVVIDEENASTEEAETNINKNEALLGLEEPTIDINSALESIISNNECAVTSHNAQAENTAISSNETAKRRHSSTDISDWNVDKPAVNDDSNKTGPIVKKRLSLTGSPDSKRPKVAVGNAPPTAKATKSNSDKTVDNIDNQKSKTNPYYPSLSSYKIPKKKTFSEPNETIISTISELFQQVGPEAKQPDVSEDAKRASDEREKLHKKIPAEDPKVPSKRKNAPEGVRKRSKDKSQIICKYKYKGVYINLKPCSVIVERCKVLLDSIVSPEVSPKAQISSSNCTSTIDNKPTEVSNDKSVHNVSKPNQHNELGCKKQYNNNNNLTINNLEVRKGGADGSETTVRNVNRISFEHYVKRKRLNSDNNKVPEQSDGSATLQVPERKRLISSEPSNDQPDIRRHFSEGPKEVYQKPRDVWDNRVASGVPHTNYLGHVLASDSLRNREYFNNTRTDRLPDNPGIECRLSNIYNITGPKEVYQRPRDAWDNRAVQYAPGVPRTNYPGHVPASDSLRNRVYFNDTRTDRLPDNPGIESRVSNTHNITGPMNVYHKSRDAWDNRPVQYASGVPRANYLEHVPASDSIRNREYFNDTRTERLPDNPAIESRVSNTHNVTPEPNRAFETTDNKSNVLQNTSHRDTSPSVPKPPVVKEQFSLLDKLLHYSEYSKTPKATGTVSRHFSAARANSLERKPKIFKPTIPEEPQSPGIAAKREPVANVQPEVDNVVKKEPPNIVVSCIHYAIKSELESFENCCSLIVDARPMLETCEYKDIEVTELCSAIVKITEVYEKTEIIHQRIPKLEKLYTNEVTFIDLTKSEDNNNNANDKITLYRSEENQLANDEEIVALSACLPGMSYLKSRKNDQFSENLEEKKPIIGRYLTVSKSLFEPKEDTRSINANTVSNEPTESSPVPQNNLNNAITVSNEPPNDTTNSRNIPNEATESSPTLQINSNAPLLPLNNLITRTISKEPAESSLPQNNPKVICNEPFSTLNNLINVRIAPNKPTERPTLPQNNLTIARLLSNEPSPAQKRPSTAVNDSNKAPSPPTSNPCNRISYPAPDVHVINATASRGLAGNSTNPNYSIPSGSRACNVDVPPQEYRATGAQNSRYPCNNWRPAALQQWHKCVGDFVYMAISHQKCNKRLWDLFKSKKLGEFPHLVESQSSLCRWKVYGRGLMQFLDRSRIDPLAAFLPQQHINLVIEYLNGLEQVPVPLPLFYLFLHCIMSETEAFYLAHPILRSFYANVKATACAITEKAKRATVRESVWDKTQLDRLKQQILVYNSINANINRSSKESGTNNVNTHRRNEVSVPSTREYNRNSYVPFDSRYTNESINPLRSIRRHNFADKFTVNVNSANSTSSNQLPMVENYLVNPTTVNNAQSPGNRPLTEPCTSINANPLFDPPNVSKSSVNVDSPINGRFDPSDVSKTSVNANPSFGDDFFDETETETCSESNGGEDCFACDSKNGVLDESIKSEEVVIDDKNGIVVESNGDEVIDLTWLDSIDCEELKIDVDFIKKEEPLEDEERFDTDGSSMDGVSSTYQYLYSGRLCICEKLATFICDCRMVMYCGTTCQKDDWKQHKQLCMKMTKQLDN
ncbi:unnamed protein product [Phyllotreta striolata]|uniref:MYND-type domain-containing protein n=1 Tax=Phyllotreta striolata TaxID=444603 RepID=A0A9N9XU77_PHYSR|nr:unnamed protein product [Phyllotreta striolata]